MSGDRPAFLRERPASQALAPSVGDRTKRLRARTGHVPGETGLWLFILGDMTVFGVFFAAFLFERGQSAAEFAASRRELTTAIGAVNTLVLLTSSLFVAAAVRAHRNGESRTAARLVAGAGACGLGFAALKGTEWVHLLGAGITPSGDSFFSFYFVLTGVHYLHMLIGLGALTLMARWVRRPRPQRGIAFVEGAGCYWHMVDALWIVLFALLYLAAT